MDPPGGLGRNHSALDALPQQPKKDGAFRAWCLATQASNKGPRTHLGSLYSKYILNSPTPEGTFIDPLKEPF